MNVLLIEDNDEKAAKVTSVLNSAANSPHIVRAKSFRSGIRELEAHLFDLLVLDMVLPVRDGEEAVTDGGAKVISEIDDGSFCNRPAHIVCLTAYESIIDSFKNEASKRLVHIVLYNETSSEWSAALSHKAQQINNRMAEANLFPEDYHIDLAIVTSSPAAELTHILKLPGFQGEFHHRDSLHYYRSNWVRSGNKSISVIACAAPSMGMTAAALTTSKVINRWRPKYLVMTGIAAGTKQDQRFGDILIAESTYDYGSGKITETSSGDKIFTPSFKQIQMDTSLFALIQRWEREQLEVDTIRRGWNPPEPNCPRVIVGVLASGAAVVQSKDLVTDILNRSRKVVGLEMEAFGVMHAVMLASTPQPKVMVVKSVSDFADSAKNDVWQQYAAYTSARFIYEFFTKENELEF